MILNKFKLKGDIKKYVNEFTKKMQNSIKRNTYEIRSMRSQISRLEDTAHEPRDFVTCNKCKNKKKELDNAIR
jgi:predicted ribosome quality control (RQC) complex YloA/Tae2 family protein